MNRAEYTPTAPPGYATVGSELTETDNEPPFRVFKFLTPKKISADFLFFRWSVHSPLATQLENNKYFGIVLDQELDFVGKSSLYQV